MFKRHLRKSVCLAAFLLAALVFPAFGQTEPSSLSPQPEAVAPVMDGRRDTAIPPYNNPQPEAVYSGAPPDSAFPARDGYSTLEAGSLDYSETDGVYHATGGVKISFASYVIETEAIVIDGREKSVVADGPFRMRIGEYLFEGESFRYFYDDERGSLTKVTSSIEGANYAADRVEFNSSNGIIMKNVIATTCCMDNKQYYVEAGTVELMDGDKAKFRDISIYFRNRKIFKWSSYTMRMGQFGGGGETSAPRAPAGGWSYSSPSLGYSSYGGIELATDIKHVNLKRKLTSGLFLDYYAMDGLFTEGRVERKTGSGYTYTLRYGKQYKANTGYFRYFSPVIVWNEPVLEIIKAENRFPGTRLYYTGRMEAGRLREKRTGRALDRAFVNLQGRYPLNAEKRRVRFSLLTDGRFAMYRKYQDFKLWGSGAQMEVGAPDNRMLRLQYMRFRNSGRTPFLSDVVNTNSKLFGYGAVKIDKINSLMVDAQYDLERQKFDEVEYTLIRDFQCLKYYISWKSEMKSVGMNLQILSPGWKKK